MERIGGIQNAIYPDTVGMDEPWNYRNKAQYPIGKDKNGKTVIEPKYNLENNLKIDFIGKWYLGEEIVVNYYCDK